MPTNVASAAIFCVRRTKKVGRGDLENLPQALGQGRNVINSVMSIDTSLGKTAKSAVGVLEKASRQEKLLEYAGKGIKFASDYMNPLICVSAGIKVLKSDDKQSSLIKETAALSAMFAGEALMKKHMDKIVKIKGIDKIAANVIEFSSKSKVRGLIPTIIKGVAFAVGSCTAYMIGQKAGSFVADKVKTDKQKTDE